MISTQAGGIMPLSSTARGLHKVFSHQTLTRRWRQEELLAVSTSDRFRKIAPLLLLLAAGLWGCSYVVVKDILDTFDPLTYLGIRFAIAVPLVALMFPRSLIAWTGMVGRLSDQSRRRHVVELLAPGLCLFIAFASQAHGMQHATPSTAAFLTSLVFLAVPILEAIAGAGQGLRRILLPVSLATAGSVILTDAWSGEFSWSNLLLVGCAFAYGAQIFLSGRVRIRVHPSVLFVTQGLVVVLCSLPFVHWARLPRYMSDPLDLARLAFLIVIATVVAYLLQFLCQGVVKARYVALIYAAEPVVALSLSSSLGYESLRFPALAGSALILAAVILSILLSTRDPLKEPANA